MENSYPYPVKATLCIIHIEGLDWVWALVLLFSHTSVKRPTLLLVSETLTIGLQGLHGIQWLLMLLGLQQHPMEQAKERD